MSILNGIISDLEAIGVVVSNEDKALRLIWSLLTSYEHMKPILMYGKDMVIYSKVTTKLLFVERRLGTDKNASIVENALVVKEGKNNDRTRPGYPPRISRVIPPSEVPLYNP